MLEFILYAYLFIGLGCWISASIYNYEVVKNCTKAEWACGALGILIWPLMMYMVHKDNKEFEGDNE